MYRSTRIHWPRIYIDTPHCIIIYRDAYWLHFFCKIHFCWAYACSRPMSSNYNLVVHTNIILSCPTIYIQTPGSQFCWCIPEDLALPALPSPDVQKQLALVPDPLKEPAPSASFTIHLAAANSRLVFGKAGFTSAEELGGFIRTAGDNLAKSCVNCWSNGLEHHSHHLDECRWRPFKLRSETWSKWHKTLQFPVRCCFYCGCPQKVCSIVHVIVVCSSHPHLDELWIGFWPKASCSWTPKWPDLSLGLSIQTSCISRLSQLGFDSKSSREFSWQGYEAGHCDWGWICAMALFWRWWGTSQLA